MQATARVASDVSSKLPACLCLIRGVKHRPMKIAYFINQAPVELDQIPNPRTKAAMEEAGRALAEGLQYRLPEEDLSDVVVRVRLHKRFLVAGRVTTEIDAPADLMRRIAQLGPPGE